MYRQIRLLLTGLAIAASPTLATLRTSRLRAPVLYHDDLGVFVGSGPTSQLRRRATKPPRHRATAPAPVEQSLHCLDAVRGGLGINADAVRGKKIFEQTLQRRVSVS